MVFFVRTNRDRVISAGRPQVFTWLKSFMSIVKERWWKITSHVWYLERINMMIRNTHKHGNTRSCGYCDKICNRLGWHKMWFDGLSTFGRSNVSMINSERTKELEFLFNNRRVLQLNSFSLRDVEIQNKNIWLILIKIKISAPRGVFHQDQIQSCFYENQIF